MEVKKLLAKILGKLISFLNPKEENVFFTQYAFREKKFKIGEYTYGIPKVRFENLEANLEIGKFCSISDNVTIFLGGNHRGDWLSTYPFPVMSHFFSEAANIVGHPSTKGSVIIGNDVWIGTNVIIMSGVKIGNGAIIGAGSVISKDIGDYEIWVGNPAQFVKKRFEDSVIKDLNKMQWWDWELEKIKKNVHLLCSSDYQNISLIK